jgi:hypothetical protein
MHHLKPSIAALFTAALVLLPLTLAACSARRPVLYPNEEYRRVGRDVAERDINDCMRRAEQFVSSGGRNTEATRQVAGSTAIGAGTGAAIGAAGGAVTGSAGEGAAVGAATGATAGLLHALFGMCGSQRDDPVFVNFVDRCLRERGYEPIGWQ